VPSEYPTIQSAIDAALLGDTVLVSPGTYTQWQVRYFNEYPYFACVFMKDGVRLASEAGPEVTVIDGGLLPHQAASVIFTWWSGSALTEVDGFALTTTGFAIRGYISRGRSIVRNCRFLDLGSESISGGGLVVRGDLELVDSSFENCRGSDAGAVLHREGAVLITDTAVRHCGPIAVRIGHSEPTIDVAILERCTFEENGPSGALVANVATAGDLTIRDCVFRGNESQLYFAAAGVEVFGVGQKLIERCLFVDNFATGPGSGVALRIYRPSVILKNTFWRNTATYSIGASAVMFADEEPGYELQNNVIAGSVGPCGAIHDFSGVVSSSCNILWDNEGGETEYFVPGPTDREVDPLFCDPDSEDFAVSSESPCLPENSLGCGLIGAFGLGCGAVHVEPQSWGRIKGAYR
jgi:hypothetical protein